MRALTGLIGALALAASPAAMLFAPTPSHFAVALVIFLCGALLCIASFWLKS